MAKGIGLDGRIGRKFLHAGPGFGGSCFPKDCRALVRTAREAQSPLSIIETVVQVNDTRKERMADKIIAACGGNVAGKTLAVLGLTFKPNTDDMRDSPSLSILPRLVAAGATIRAFDPEGMGEAKKLLPDIVYCADAYETMDGRRRARAADRMERVSRAGSQRGSKACCAAPVVIDLRNIYSPQEMVAAGLSYHQHRPPGAHRAAPQLRAFA